LPLIQGAMGVKVSTSALAIAVAKCGAASTIAGVGLGYGAATNEEDYFAASRDALREEIRKAKAATDGVVGVNAMVALSNYDDLVRISVAENVDFIASGAGLPLKLPELAGNGRTKLVPIVSSARAAGIVVRTWKKRYNRLPDAIIVEGPMAGGHLGFKADEVRTNRKGMLEEIVGEGITRTEELKTGSGAGIPGMAAGGVFDGKDIARFLRLGAKGVQMATRFVVTHECDVAEPFKEAYLKAKDEDIVIIDSPVGMPGRSLKTPLVEKAGRGVAVPFECHYQCLRSCDPNTAPYCIAKAMFAASRGDVENAVVFCGSNVSRVDRRLSVKELIDELMEEAGRELAA